MSDRSNKQNTYTLRSLYVSQTHPPLKERYPHIDSMLVYLLQICPYVYPYPSQSD